MKKKLILLISTIIFVVLPSFANCDYLNYCSDKGNITSSPIGQFFSDKTGVTFLAEQFVDNSIKNELKKYTNQDFNVDLKAFNLSDLINGNFKSLTVTGNNIEIQGVHISSLKVQTLCDFNSIDIKQNTIKLKENMVLGVWLEISEEDLRNTFSYNNYADEFNKTDLSSLGLYSCRIYPETIGISDGKLYFTINAVSAGKHSPFDIAICGDIIVKDGNVIKSQINLINIFTGFDLTKFSNWLNPVQYMNFPVNILGYKAQVKIQNINLIENKAFINGIIFIPKEDTE